LKPLETGKFRSWLQQHFPSLQMNKEAA
jgi:hypothetical protein